MDLLSFFVYSVFVPLIFFSLYIKRKKYWSIAIIVIILFTILMGYRYNVGFDWMQYRDNFILSKNGALAMERNYEPVYTAINIYFSKHLGLHYWSLMLLECFLYIFSIFLFCKLAKSNLVAAIACTLFYCISFFNAINTSREFLALSFMLIGNYLLISNETVWNKNNPALVRIVNVKNILGLFFMLLSASTHTSMIIYPIIFFVFIFYQPSKLNYKVLFVLYGVLFVLFKTNINNIADEIYSLMLFFSGSIEDERISIYIGRDFLDTSSRHYQSVSMLRSYFFATLDLIILYPACVFYNWVDDAKLKYICLFAVVYILFANTVLDFELFRRLLYAFLPFFSFMIGILCVQEHKKFRFKAFAIKFSSILYLFFAMKICMFILDINWKTSNYGDFFKYKVIPNIESIL